MNFSTFDSIFNPNFLHRNETSLVNLELMNGDEKVQQVIYGRDYKLKAHFCTTSWKANSLVTIPKSFMLACREPRLNEWHLLFNFPHL